MKSNISRQIHNLSGLLTLLFILIVMTGCSPFSQNKINALEPNNNSEPFRTTYNTPKNLHFVKQELTAYHNSGSYEAGLNQVGNAAMIHLLKCKNTPGKKAIVFDIDETSLSNYGYEEKTDYGYSSTSWAKWIQSGGPVAIKPSLALFNQAKEQGIATFFITGGKENLRKYYEANLKKAGYSGWTKLIMEPADSHYKRAENFKAPHRQKITEEGYRIVVNIGDQYSDLIGGYADKTFKYPNPFYYVP